MFFALRNSYQKKFLKSRAKVFVFCICINEIYMFKQVKLCFIRTFVQFTLDFKKALSKQNFSSILDILELSVHMSNFNG